MIKEALLVQNVLLGEVCTITYGKGLSTKQLLDTGFPVFGANGIIGFYDKYIYEKSEVLISCRGAYSGKINLSPPNCYVTNNSLILFIKDDKSLSKKYLYYILNSVNKSKLVTGTAQPQVTINNAVNLSFPLPKIEVQDAIVEKIEELFSELDKSIENLKTAQQQLKVYRQAVLKWAFEGKLTNEGLKDGELPKGWEWVKLGTFITKIEAGKSYKCDERPPSESEIGIVKVSAVTWGEFNEQESKTCFNANQLNESYFIHEGDFLFSRANTLDLVGTCVIVKSIRKYLMLSDKILRFIFKNDLNKNYALYFLRTQAGRKQIKLLSTGNQESMRNIGQEKIKQISIPVCDFSEQQRVVEEIESRLSVCDKMEETITTSLQQAEALRQSILKKAFEGKLVKQQAKPIYKPKNVYFYQMQVLGKIATASKEKGISHGEMTIAKYAYLVDKIFQIPTYYDYKRWHLGPYPPEIKKAINNSKFFTKNNNSIDVIDIATLNKYPHPFADQLQDAINDLSNIFLPYETKNRSHQIELLATVCKVIEDIQSTDLEAIRASMAEWIIDLPTTHFKSKAEKFSEKETSICLKMAVEKGWIDKLIVK